MKTSTIIALALLSAASQAQDWASTLEYATDGHSYLLARKQFSTDRLFNPEWKSLGWNFGVVGGRDVTASLDCAGGSLLVKVSGSSGFYAGATLNVLTKSGQQGMTLQGALTFGWSAKF